MPKVNVDFDGVTLGFKELTKDVFDVINDEAEAFFTDLIDRNPVDTGDMKRSWQTSAPSFNGEWVWKAKNAMDYSDIITQGRRLVGGRWYGSIKQWGAGGTMPLLEKMTNRIIKEIDELKI